MKGMISLVAWLLLVSAHALAEPWPPTQVVLSAGPDEAGVVIAPSKEGLLLGQTRLEPWRYVIPDCRNCNLSLERDFSPVGPDRTVRLTRSGSVQTVWFFAERLRLPASLPGRLALRGRTNGEVSLEAGDARRILKPGIPTKLNGCEYVLTWFEQSPSPDTRPEPTPQAEPGTAAPAPIPTIIGEDPAYRVQVVGTCL